MKTARLICVAYLWCFSVFAIPLSEDVQAKVAASEDIVKASRNRGFKGPYASVQVIRESFRVPISFEWSFVDDDRVAIEPNETVFFVKEGETLRESLDRFCAETGGLLQWRQIHGIFCVWPTTKEPVESTLDSLVTLELNGLSTWHAVVETCRQVNTGKDDRALIPRAEPGQDRYVPPNALRNHNTISLSFSGVTARDAICSIFAASPLYVEFTYGNYYRSDSENPRPPSSSLSITAFDDSRTVLYDIVDSLGMEESRLWHEEAKSAVPPEKNKAAPPKD